MNADSYATLVDAGLCPGCKGDPRPGRVYCQPCADKIASYHEETRAETARTLRAGRRAAGLCPMCGKQPPVKPKGWCQPCRDHHSKWARENRLKAGAQKRVPPPPFTADDLDYLTPGLARLVRHVLAGRTPPEIAALDNVTVGTVRVALWKARQLVTKALAPCPDCGLRGPHVCAGAVSFMRSGSTNLGAL